MGSLAGLLRHCPGEWKIALFGEGLSPILTCEFLNADAGFLGFLPGLAPLAQGLRIENRAGVGEG